MILKGYLLLFGFLFLSITFAQEMPKIIPPSPTAYKLGTYGKVPVNKYTGTINYTIPVFNYKTKNLTIPISLTYRSNGVKIDEMNTNVGLGWSLDGIGLISRIIRDKPDEYGNQLLPSKPIHEEGAMSPTSLSFFYLSQNENVDTEPDLYSYNFLGYSGKFIIKDNTIINIPKNDIEFNISTDINHEKNFIATAPDGIQYYFEEKELTISRIEHTDGIQPPEPAITVWYLTKIVHPKGDEITIKYASQNYSYILSQSQSFKIKTPLFQVVCSHGNTPNFKISSIIKNRIQYASKKIERIESKDTLNGKIIFNYINRNNSPSLINDIIYKNNEGYIVNSMHLDYLITNNDRVFLNGVTFKDISKKYNFEYIDPYGLPERLSKSKDYYGYYNGKNNNYLFPKPENLEMPINQVFSYFSDIGADKSVDERFAKKGLLNKIENPLKGTTSIEYESNSYYGEVYHYGDLNMVSLEAITNDTTFLKTDTLHINVPFTQTIKFYANVSYDEHCSVENTSHNRASLSIVDENENYVSISEKTLMGYLSVNNPLSIDTLTLPKYVTLEKNKNYTLILKAHSPCTNSTVNIEYYPNEYNVTYENIKAGGLRIKRIVNLQDNDTLKVMRYYYGDIDNPNFSSGIKGETPYFITKNVYRQGCDLPCSYYDINYQTLNSSSIRNLFYDNIGTTKYRYVTVSEGGDDFELGGKEYQFYTSQNIPANILWGEYLPSTPLINIGWDDGLLERKTIYKKKNNRLYKLYREKNYYKKIDSLTSLIYGYHVNKKFDLICTNDIIHVCTSEDVNDIQFYSECRATHIHFYSENTKSVCITQGNINYIMPTGIVICTAPHQHLYQDLNLSYCVKHGNKNHIWHRKNKCFNHQVGDTVVYPNTIENLDINEYSTNSYRFYLDHKKEISYFNDEQDSLIIDNKFFYDGNNHFQLTKTQTLDSYGHIIETLSYYPKDKSKIENQDYEESRAIDSLIIRHQIGIPIQTKTYYNHNLLSQQRTVFQVDDSGVILPKEIKNAKGNNNFEPRIIYHDYDQYANPIEISKADGIHIYYIWGYNHSQPIAEIKNFSSNDIDSTIQNLIDEAVTASNSDIDDTSENTLRQKLNALKNALPDNTQMTSYTYDLLIGVTSITEPNGNVTYYKYDSFNRLHQIVDKDGHILKEYNYHYKTN